MIKKTFVGAGVAAALLVSMAGAASATHSHRIETGNGACVDRNGAGFGTDQVHGDNTADPGDTTFHERFHKGTPGTFAFERPGNPVSVIGGLCPT